MRFLILQIAVFGCINLYSGDDTLSRRSLINGRITMCLPKDFNLMSEEVLKLKYPFERRPTLVFTNFQGTVNIAINHTKNKMPESELALFHKWMEKNLKNLYPSSKWSQSNMTTINKKQFFIVEFETPAMDTTIHNIMAGTILDDFLLLVSFNVTNKQKSEWLTRGKLMIESIQIKP